jgi:outer membrane lipoprotein-sorting protein
MKVSRILIYLNLIFISQVVGQELTGEQIIQKVDDILSPNTSYGKAEMTIITTSGEERTFVYDSWSKNEGEKNLIRYISPSRVKGQATLMLNHSDDIWMYFPRTSRVRKLASHAKKQKMQGSDFSYEDLGSGDTFIEDFTAKRLEDEVMEEKDCYKLELTKKEDSDLSYSRMIMWVIKENFYPLVIDYYDEDNPQKLLKRLVQSNFKTIDGFPTALDVVMYNKIDNTHTKMRLLEIRYNLPLDDAMFTERELKK